MEPYIFIGKILPERAMLSLSIPSTQINFADGTSSAEMKVNILLNQLLVKIDTDHQWNVNDLRNTVRDLVQSYLSMIGFIAGHAYDLEITRVICDERGIDYVFGIDIPCLNEISVGKDKAKEMEKLQRCSEGENGKFIRRCLNDLVSAMKNVEDTGFYCYRAVEALRNHSASESNLSDQKDATKWDHFRSVAGVERESIMAVKAYADPLRHGRPTGITEAERIIIFQGTWGIVQAYFNALAQAAGAAPRLDAT